MQKVQSQFCDKLAYNCVLIGIQTRLTYHVCKVTRPAITLLGVSKALFGVQCQTLNYRLMSRRKLVPVDPEHQPPIRTFVSECRKAGLAGTTGWRIANKVINKKRHRSSEDRKSEKDALPVR